MVTSSGVHITAPSMNADEEMFYVENTFVPKNDSGRLFPVYGKDALEHKRRQYNSMIERLTLQMTPEEGRKYREENPFRACRLELIRVED